MAKFVIDYWESYTSTYTVEAENYEEAVEKLTEAIRCGEVKGPEECYSSGCGNLTMNYTEEQLAELTADVE